MDEFLNVMSEACGVPHIGRKSIEKFKLFLRKHRRFLFMKKKISGVYIIKCIANGKIYVGSSNDIARRWSCHLSLLKSGKHTNKALQEDFDTYGIDRISFRIKEECLQKDLYERELYYFKRYEPEQLYNSKGIRNTHKKIRRGKEAANYRESWSQKNQGENNPHCTKFNVELIKEIKRMLKDGVDMQIIADKYNTTKGYIYAIASGRRWSSINID